TGGHSAWMPRKGLCASFRAKTIAAFLASRLSVRMSPNYRGSSPRRSRWARFSKTSPARSTSTQRSAKRSTRRPGVPWASRFTSDGDRKGAIAEGAPPEALQHEGAFKEQSNNHRNQSQKTKAPRKQRLPRRNSELDEMRSAFCKPRSIPKWKRRTVFLDNVIRTALPQTV